MKISKALKLASAIVETVLGIPILGGLIVLSLAWTPLVIALTLHIVTLIFSVKQKIDKPGSVLGIVTSCVGWIPGIGMIMHIISAVILWIEWAKV